MSQTSPGAHTPRADKAIAACTYRVAAGDRRAHPTFNSVHDIARLRIYLNQRGDVADSVL